MTRRGCSECDEYSEHIRQYCKNCCRKARIARKFGLTTLDKVCLDCPLRLALTGQENHEHINRVLFGELLEPPPATQDEIIGGLDV